MKLRFGIFTLVASVFWTCAAGATDATVTTQICIPLAQTTAVQLTPADDSALYLSVKEDLRRAVVTSGHPVQETADMELYYSLVETAVEIRGQGPTLGKLDVRTVNRGARAQLLVNLWASNADSLLGGRKTRSGLRVSNVLIVTLELNRQDNGRCVWRGEGAVELGTVTAEEVAPGLATAVAAQIGQAIDGIRVPLR